MNCSNNLPNILTYTLIHKYLDSYTGCVTLPLYTTIVDFKWKKKSSCDCSFEFQVKFRGLIRILHYLFRNYSNFLYIVLHVQRLKSPWIINLVNKSSLEHQAKPRTLLIVSLSRSAITRCLHKCKSRRFRTRWKPLVTLRNWNNRLGKVWRRGDIAHDLKQTTSSVKHGGGNVMAQACTTVSGAGSLLIMWLLIEAKGWIVRYTELYSLLRFSQML